MQVYTHTQRCNASVQYGPLMKYFKATQCTFGKTKEHKRPLTNETLVSNKMHHCSIQNTQRFCLFSLICSDMTSRLWLLKLANFR